MSDREVILADDFTGAAEMAGIAWRSGRSVDFCTSLPNVLVSEVTVIDTDTRLLSEAEASERIRDICQRIRGWGVSRVFKKVDSVLRGPIRAEAEAAVTSLGRSGAVLLSANPTKSRMIVDGRYRVDGVPLHETDFARDPIHPALTDSVRERVGESPVLRTPDATSWEDVREVAASLDPGVLPIGAADFYTAWSEAPSWSMPAEPTHGTRLWLGGSQAIREAREEACDRFGIPVVEWNGEATEEWERAAKSAFELQGRVALEVGRIMTREPGDVLAAFRGIGSRLVKRLSPDYVFIEGGAISSAVMDALGWDRFRVVREWSLGVVGVRPVDETGASELVVKPGSYPWPNSVFSFS